MGEWRPTKAAAYTSDSHEAMKEALASAIAEKLSTDPAAEARLLKACPSCRPANVRDYRNGDGALYGIVRLTQTAEALGMRPEITFRRHPYDRTPETRKPAAR